MHTHLIKMLILTSLFFLSALRYTTGQGYVAHSPRDNMLGKADLKGSENILNTTEDIIRDSDERVALMYDVRVDNMRSAPFEVGYLMYSIQEKYRKMVDKYNTSLLMGRMLYVMEHVLYLEEIEHHYWEIDHLCNMAHEIERKYKIKGGLHDDFRLHGLVFNVTTPENPYLIMTKKKRPKWKWERDILPRLMSTTKKRYRGMFPIDYGWEVEGLP